MVTPALIHAVVLAVATAAGGQPATLLQTQGKDGGWNVPQEAINRGPRKLNVYSYRGTAWAAIGMLQALPAPANSR